MHEELLIDLIRLNLHEDDKDLPNNYHLIFNGICVVTQNTLKLGLFMDLIKLPIIMANKD